MSWGIGLCHGGSTPQNLVLSLTADPCLYMTRLFHSAFFTYSLSQPLSWLQMLGADVALVGGFWGNGFQFLQFWDNCLGLTGHLLSLGGWMEAWCWEVCASVSQQR